MVLDGFFSYFRKSRYLKIENNIYLYTHLTIHFEECKDLNVYNNLFEKLKLKEY